MKVDLGFTTEYHNQWTPIGSIMDTRMKNEWMLFWPQALLAQKWQAICKAWDEGQLLGVIGCSTEKPNSRSSNLAEGIIILYCNNSEDEEFISAELEQLKAKLEALKKT